MPSFKVVMAAARVLESAPLFTSRRNSDPATSADSQSATAMPVREHPVRAVCARARGHLALRCHAARPAADTTVTRLERCAERTLPCCRCRSGPFCRDFPCRAAVPAPPPTRSSRFFSRGTRNWSCAGASPALNIALVSLDRYSVDLRVSCPSLVTVSRGGVARLVQNDSGGEQHTSNVATAFRRTTLIG